MNRHMLLNMPDDEVLQVFSKSTDDYELELLAREASDRGIQAAKDKLVELLTHRNERVKTMAIESLYCLGAHDACDAILSLFVDKSQPTSVRDTAAYILGRFKFKPALAVFQENITKEDGTVKSCVKFAIDSIMVL